MDAFPNLTAIVLAAGLSRRMAPRHKLLLPAPDGSDRPVIAATVAAVTAAGLGEVIVVTGHERERIEVAIAGAAVRCVFATEFAQGMGHSLAAGVKAARADAAGFVVVPGDLPELNAAIVRMVAECFVSEHGRFHVIPMAAGARGHPVILGAWLRPQLEALTGDVGARHVLASPAEAGQCCFLEVGDPAILCDVDQAT